MIGLSVLVWPVRMYKSASLFGMVFLFWVIGIHVFFGAYCIFFFHPLSDCATCINSTRIIFAI